MKKHALMPYRVPCVWEPSEGQRKKKRTKAVEHSFTRANTGWNGHPQRDISRTGSPSFGDAIPPFPMGQHDLGLRKRRKFGGKRTCRRRITLPPYGPNHRTTPIRSIQFTACAYSCVKCPSNTSLAAPCASPPPLFASFPPPSSPG